MKNKLIAAVAALALLVLPLFALAPVAHASGFRSGDSVVVNKDEVVNSTLFAAGNNIEIAGTVDGDVFCAGQNVTITGTVRGDVICAGQTVRVNGAVEGDVRVAGQVVTLQSEVDGNVTAASQNFTAEKGSKLRDLTVAGNTVTLNGEVMRDVSLASESATLNGTIGRDVQAQGEQLTFGADSETGGDVTYYSRNEAERQQGAQIAGSVDRHEPQRGSEVAAKDTGLATGGIIFAFLTVLVTAMALVALFPRALQRVSTNAVEKPGTTVLIGVAVLFLTPVFVVGLMLTGVGFMLGILLLLTYILLLVASGPLTGYYVGRMLLRNNTANPLLYMLLGVSIVTLLYFIPIIGQLAMLAVLLFGTGMVVREMVRRSANPTYDFATEPAKPVKTKTTRAKKK